MSSSPRLCLSGFIVCFGLALSCNTTVQGAHQGETDLGDGDGDALGGSDGVGGEGSGGSAAGGSDSSGGTGGEGDGSGGTGGDGTSGGGTGGDGTGGFAGDLVNDFSQGVVLSNSPFWGALDRYIQPDGVWGSPTVGDMIVSDPEDPTNLVLRVHASDCDTWGVGVYFNLNAGVAIDLSAYTGIRFRARGVETLRVQFADAESFVTTCTDYCDEHALAPASALTSEWLEYQLSLASFFRTSPAPDLTEVYALHFNQDPSGTDVDFYVDDIYFY